MNNRLSGRAEGDHARGDADLVEALRGGVKGCSLLQGTELCSGEVRALLDHAQEEVASSRCPVVGELPIVMGGWIHGEGSYLSGHGFRSDTLAAMREIRDADVSEVVAAIKTRLQDQQAIIRGQHKKRDLDYVVASFRSEMDALWAAVEVVAQRLDGRAIEVRDYYTESARRRK
ncbi:hypothetical protein [Leifsonia xyli]|uniref:hypothetical protein n=1 Tax=Leifsonia xyli TaxID=1575 RepID=UPI003D66C912